MARNANLAIGTAQTKRGNDLGEVKGHRSTAPNAHAMFADSSEPRQSPAAKNFQRLSEAVAAQPDVPAFALVESRPSEGFMGLDALRRRLQIYIVVTVIPLGAVLLSLVPALLLDGSVFSQEEAIDENAVAPSIVRSEVNVDTPSGISRISLGSSASAGIYASAGNLAPETVILAADAKTGEPARLNSTLRTPAVIPLTNPVNTDDQELGANPPSPGATAAGTPEPGGGAQDSAPAPASKPRFDGAAPGSTDPYVAAHRLLQNGDLPGAEDALRRALHSPSPRASVFYDLGRVLERQGKHYEAAESYQAAIRLAPTRAYLHYNLGISLSRLGRLEEAAPSFERAATLDPDNPYVFYDWGWTLERLGRLAEAREKYELSIEKDKATSAATNARKRLKILKK